jgi:hypothetical protein
LPLGGSASCEEHHMRQKILAMVAAMSAGAALTASSISTAGATSAPPDLSSAEVCELIDPAVIGDTLGVTVTGTEALDLDTPQCKYEFQDDAQTFTNAVVAVQRVEGDLGGLVGTTAFKYVVKLNKQLADKKTTFTRVKGVGKRATFVKGSATNLMIVLADDGRVITILASNLTKGAARSIGAAAVEGLG